jgi:hypothetical protein
MSPKEEDEHDKGRKISMGGSVRTGKAQLKNLEASDHALAARSANQRSWVVIWEQVHTLIHQ